MMSTYEIKDLKLTDFLKTHLIAFDIYKHRPTYTVSEAKLIKEKIPGLHTKNLFLEDQDGKCYLVSMNGEKRLNIKTLRRFLRVKKLHFADPKRMKEVLNTSPGHCSIFSLIYTNKCTLVLERSLWESKKVGFHPNKNDATLVINHKNLDKYLKAINFDPKLIIDL